MQSEDLAISKCINATLTLDPRLSVLLPGGVWIDEAPEIAPNAKNPPASPYLVITTISGPDSIGGNRQRLFTDPLIRCMVWGDRGPTGGTARGAAMVKAVDLAFRRLDTILETLRYTAMDSDYDALNGDPREDYEIRGFTRESYFADLATYDGHSYRRRGGDYRGFVYLVNRCP